MKVHIKESSWDELEKELDRLLDEGKKIISVTPSRYINMTEIVYEEPYEKAH